MRNYFLFVISWLLILSGCNYPEWVNAYKNLTTDDTLVLIKTPYFGTELRTDGFYYNIWGTDKNCSAFFLYRNGVATYPYSVGTIEECEAAFLNGQFLQDIKSDKSTWGLFAVNGKTIKLEFLRAYGAPHRYSMTDFGKILNDTTISIYKTELQDGSTVDDPGETYHFKLFLQKPDSTNKWIK
jgi:hypothetical protein